MIAFFKESSLDIIRRYLKMSIIYEGFWQYLEKHNTAVWHFHTPRSREIGGHVVLIALDELDVGHTDSGRLSMAREQSLRLG
jgi:hypothetical protein